MHQPDYRDPETGQLAMPWVRLHSLRGYLDMLHVCQRASDEARAVFNFVPSLLAQMEGYLDGTLTDRYLEISRKPVADLSADERTFVVSNFFHANSRTMVDCFPRYRQLRMLSRLPGGAPRDLKDVDLHDLVVWFNLAWMGYTARREYPLVDELIRQGSRFSEEQKQDLLDLHLTIMRRIVPDYREALEDGLIEITATPFYHPILPLLCDTDAAAEGLPGRRLPEPPFSAPEDANTHVARALDHHERVFGKRPSGMWPAEGSVSPEAVGIFAENGVSWIATDQDILSKSLPKSTRADLFQPHLTGKSGSQVSIVFRERELADSIGFRYASMSAERAVADFMTRLRTIHKEIPKRAAPSLVTVILDGENAWEYYPDSGEGFLTAMYREVADSPDFAWTTISDYLSDHPATSSIPKIFPGSWIGGNFDIWIGSEEENAGWAVLRNARRALVQKQDDLAEDSRHQAWEQLYAAEGSDWFWWYGDDFTTSLQPEFDRLFRAHVARVYHLIGATTPPEVLRPIKRGREQVGRRPVGLVTPTLDGNVTNYYEWVGAGELDTSKADSSMARGERVISSIHYGADHKNLYLRVDLASPHEDEATGKLEIRWEFVSHPGTAVLIAPFARGGASASLSTKGGRTRTSVPCVADDVIECALPLMAAGFAPGTQCEFIIAVEADGSEVERWPRDGLLAVEAPSEEYELDHWSA